jgi:two-component system sensor histidine kinase BaeS
VFDRFWRAGQSNGRMGSGTGLGLAIVKKIAEAHGGGAEASSNSAGGATFRIRLAGFAWSAWPMAAVEAPRADRLRAAQPERVR